MLLNLFKYYAPKYKDAFNLAFDKNGLYFQIPKKFNDPWDCKAPEPKIPRQANVIKSVYFDLAKKRGIREIQRRWALLSSQPRKDLKNAVIDMYKAGFEVIRSSIGVYCLSCIPDSELMWSHYADSHKGYMLHFQIDYGEYMNLSMNQQIGLPTAVMYKDKLEPLNLREYMDNPLDGLERLIKNKSSVWDYECEIRIVNPHKSGFIKLPTGWLKSIVCGINIDPKLRDKLTSIASLRNLKVYNASMNDQDYKVDIPNFHFDGKSGRKQFKEFGDICKKLTM